MPLALPPMRPEAQLLHVMEPFGEGPYARTVLLSVCLYEATALLSAGRVPTISTLLRARPRRLRAVTVAAASTWLAFHFLHPRWP